MKKKTTKRTKVRLITALMAISILIFGMFCVLSSAEDTERSDNMVEDHFDNLGIVFPDESSYQPMFQVPPNMHSCCYVSLSMLLSFYDTYWCDDFVDENLEWTKGVYNCSEDKLITTFNANDEYEAYVEWVEDNPQGTDVDFVEEYELTFLQPYLISYAIERNFHVNDIGDFGLTGEELKLLLESYLYFDRGFVASQLEVKSLTGTQDELFAKMQEIIDEGFPVIYGGYSTPNAPDEMNSNFEMTGMGSVGHAMIAYKNVVNNNKNDIVLHNGDSEVMYPTWSFNSQNPYDENGVIIWLEINETALPHQCSDNYVDSVTGEEICACKIYSNHPNHSENHYYLPKKDNYKHWDECHCGDIANEEDHNLTYQIYDNHHIAECSDCGFSIETDHEYSTKVDANKQWQQCVCGQTVIDHYHNFSYVNLNGNQHIRNCSDCNYFDGSENHKYTLVSASSTQHHSKCACGRVNGSAQAHYPYRYSYVSNLSHNVICECGYIIGASSHTLVADTPTKSHCTGCNAIFTTRTDITINGKEDEDELYTE